MSKNLVDLSISVLEGGLFVAMTIEVVRSFVIVRVAKKLDAKRKTKPSKTELN